MRYRSPRPRWSVFIDYWQKDINGTSRAKKLATLKDVFSTRMGTLFVGRVRSGRVYTGVDAGNETLIPFILQEDRLWVADPKGLHHILALSGYLYEKPYVYRERHAVTLDRGLFWAAGRSLQANFKSATSNP